MSRDFLITCASPVEATEAERRLLQVRADDGQAVFAVDNRGSDLFVILTYPDDLPEGMGVSLGEERIADFSRYVAFVAIKNGEHDSVGYFSDSGRTGKNRAGRFPLAKIPTRIRDALGIDGR